MPGKKKKTQHSFLTFLHKDRNQVSSTEENKDRLWLKRDDHPLLNHVILDTLFNYVKAKEVRACRLVSKRWNASALPLFRSKFQIMIINDNALPLFGLRHIRMSEFLAMYDSNTSIEMPFSNFRLSSFDPKIGSSQKFFQMYGTAIRKYSNYDDYSIENVSTLLKAVPNLEHFLMSCDLHLNDETFNDGGVKPRKLFSGSESEIPSLKFLKTFELGSNVIECSRRVCPTFLEEFLSVAENISNLFVPYTREQGLVLELFQIVEKLGRGSKIETLSLFHVDPEILEIVKKIERLKLKNLSIKDAKYVRDGSWSELVDLMKDSLVSLQVQNSDTLNRFSRMPELKLLDLEICNYCPTSDVIFNDFSISFPKLKYLRLIPFGLWENIELDEFYVGSECCPIMETLYLGKYMLNIQTFERTLDVFPNLKELGICILNDGPNILQKIWSGMTRLEKLNIYGHLEHGSDMESLFTGFPIDEIKKIRGLNMKKLLKDMTIEARKEKILSIINEYELIRAETLSSIRNMTNLRHLTLDISVRGYKYKSLGDLTGYFCLYTMKYLRHVSISSCNFSRACCEMLVTDLELCSWRIKNKGDWDCVIPPRPNSEKNGEWDFPCSKFLHN